MNQDEAFLVYKKIVKGSIIDAGGSFDISPEIDSKLCKYFEKFMKSINDIRNTILFNSAKHTILVAEVNDMNQNEAFLVFKKILKGSGGFDINNPEIHFKLYKYFEKFMKSINHIRKQE
jgi:hypothetical protein